MRAACMCVCVHQAPPAASARHSRGSMEGSSPAGSQASTLQHPAMFAQQAAYAGVPQDASVAATATATATEPMAFDAQGAAGYSTWVGKVPVVVAAHDPSALLPMQSSQSPSPGRAVEGAGLPPQATLHQAGLQGAVMRGLVQPHMPTVYAPPGGLQVPPVKKVGGEGLWGAPVGEVSPQQRLAPPQPQQVVGFVEYPAHPAAAAAPPREPSVGLPVATPPPALDEDAIANLPPSSERPCAHNDWDDVRTRKGTKMLRCRACQRKWKLPSNHVPRCLHFLRGSCHDNCSMLHVHKKKCGVMQRYEQFGEAVLQAMPKHPPQPQAAKVAGKVPVPEVQEGPLSRRTSVVSSVSEPPPLGSASAMGSFVSMGTRRSSLLSGSVLSALEGSSVGYEGSVRPDSHMSSVLTQDIQASWGMQARRMSLSNMSVDSTGPVGAGAVPQAAPSTAGFGVGMWDLCEFQGFGVDVGLRRSSSSLSALSASQRASIQADLEALQRKGMFTDIPAAGESPPQGLMRTPPPPPIDAAPVAPSPRPQTAGTSPWAEPLQPLQPALAGYAQGPLPGGSDGTPPPVGPKVMDPCLDRQHVGVGFAGSSQGTPPPSVACSTAHDDVGAAAVAEPVAVASAPVAIGAKVSRRGPKGKKAAGASPQISGKSCPGGGRRNKKSKRDNDGVHAMTEAELDEHIKKHFGGQ